MFCKECGNEVNEKAVICLKCGCSFKTNQFDDNTRTKSGKSRSTYVILALFLGTLGVHNFYAGYIGRGIAQLILSCTYVGLIITIPWIIVEMCIINKDANNNKLI